MCFSSLFTKKRSEMGREVRRKGRRRRKFTDWDNVRGFSKEKEETGSDRMVEMCFRGEAIEEAVALSRIDFIWARISLDSQIRDERNDCIFGA